MRTRVFNALGRLFVPEKWRSPCFDVQLLEGPVRKRSSLAIAGNSDDKADDDRDCSQSQEKQEEKKEEEWEKHTNWLLRKASRKWGREGVGSLSCCIFPFLVLKKKHEESLSAVLKSTTTDFHFFSVFFRLVGDRVRWLVDRDLNRTEDSREWSSFVRHLVDLFFFFLSFFSRCGVICRSSCIMYLVTTQDWLNRRK